MPISGRKPKPEGAKRNRVRPVMDWTEVDRVRFKGGPKLPAKMADGRSWPARTVKWWSVISSMPHCVLWEQEDWEFALDTAAVAAAFHGGDIRQADTLMKREKVLGTTMDFRRDLRIRYVEPSSEVPAGITAIEEYRRMIEE